MLANKRRLSFGQYLHEVLSAIDFSGAESCDGRSDVGQAVRPH